MTPGTAFRANMLSLALAAAIHLPSIDTAMADSPVAPAILPASASYPQTVYRGAIASPVSPDLATFADMMKIAFPGKSLKSFFNGPSHTTIFAPTNTAFESLLASMTEQQRANLLDPNTGFLEAILRVHFTEGDWYLQPPPFGIRRPADTVGGLRMANDEVANVFRDGTMLHIECAKVGERLVFANGVVHLVDKVVMPSNAPKKLRCEPPTDTN